MKRPLPFATLLLFSAIHLFVYAESSTFNLQKAIDDADRSDTIVVPKGTYTQPIVIDKQLTLDGKGAIIAVVSDLPAIKIDTSKQVSLKNLEIRYQTKQLESDEFSLFSPYIFSPFQRKLGAVFFCRLFFARLSFGRYLQLNHFPVH